MGADHRDMLDPNLAERIILALKHDEPISVSDLSVILGGQPSKSLAAIAVLAKMGFVSLEALTDG